MPLFAGLSTALHRPLVPLRGPRAPRSDRPGVRLHQPQIQPAAQFYQHEVLQRKTDLSPGRLRMHAFVHRYIPCYSTATHVGNQLDFHNQSSVWPNRSMVDCIIGSWGTIFKISAHGWWDRGNDMSHHSIRDVDLLIIAMICNIIFNAKHKVFS